MRLVNHIPPIQIRMLKILSIAFPVYFTTELNMDKP